MRALRCHIPRALPGAHPLPPARLVRRQLRRLCRHCRPRRHASGGERASWPEEIAPGDLPLARARGRYSSTGLPTTSALSASPGSAAEFYRMLFDTDVSDVLPNDPRADARAVPRSGRRETALRAAGLIPGARAVQLPGEDGAIWTDDEPAQEVERFLSGREKMRVPDSILTTVLFTDIVGSTERAADSRRQRPGVTFWPAITRRCAESLPASAARKLDTAGDGFFASFDGPGPRAIRCAQAIVIGRPGARARRSARGCTPASASCTTASSRGSPSASAREWPVKRRWGPSPSPAP